MDGQIIQQKSNIFPQELINAWEEAYNDSLTYKYPHRHKWLFTDNPFVVAKDYYSFYYVKLENGCVAAWACSIVVPLIIEKYKVLAGMSIDTFTLQKYRCKGYGKLLQLTNQNKHDVFLSIGMSEANRRNKIRIGGIPLKPMMVFCKQLKAMHFDTFEENYYSTLNKKSKFLAYISKVFNLHTLFKYVVDLLFCNSRIKKVNKRVKYFESTFKEGFVFERINIFDHETQQVWDNYKDNFTFFVDRSCDYLNWKYCQQPHINYLKYKVKLSGKVVGFFVFRHGLKVECNSAIISEVVLIDKYRAIFHYILEYIEKAVKSEGGRYIYIGTTLKSQMRSLVDNQFILFKEYTPIVNSNNATLKRALVKNELTTFITLGDQDLDYIRIKNQPTIYDQLNMLKFLFFRRFTSA